MPLPFIKSITLNRFKTYVGKTTIHFSNTEYGVCIIGDNGSGKSSIYDGLLFTLYDWDNDIFNPPQSVISSLSKTTASENNDTFVSIEFNNNISIKKSIDISTGTCVYELNGKVLDKEEIIPILTQYNITTHFNIFRQNSLSNLVSDSHYFHNLVSSVLGHEVVLNEAIPNISQIVKKLNKNIQIGKSKLDSISSAIEYLVEENKKYENQKDLLNEKELIEYSIIYQDLNILNSQIEEKENEIQLSNIPTMATNNSIRNLHEEKNKLISRQNEIKAELNKLRQQSLNTIEFENEKIESFTQNSLINTDDIDELLLRKCELECKILSYQKKNNERSTFNMSDEEYKNLQEKLDNIVLEIETITEKINTNKEKISSFEADEEKLKNEIDMITREHEDFCREKAKLSNNCANLEMIIFNAEKSLKLGYNFKNSLNIARGIDQNAQFLANFISVEDDIYLQAIETILSSKLWYIMVDNDDIGSKIITSARRQDASVSIGVIPLNTFKSSSLEDISASGEEFIKMIDVIKVVNETDYTRKNQIQRVLEHFLKNVYIVESLTCDFVTPDLRSSGGKYTAVTLDGDFVTNGGIVKGGYRGHESKLKLFMDISLKGVELDKGREECTAVTTLCENSRLKFQALFDNKIKICQNLVLHKDDNAALRKRLAILGKEKLVLKQSIGHALAVKSVTDDAKITYDDYMTSCKELNDVEVKINILKNTLNTNLNNDITDTVEIERIQECEKELEDLKQYIMRVNNDLTESLNKTAPVGRKETIDDNLLKKRASLEASIQKFSSVFPQPILKSKLELKRRFKQIIGDLAKTQSISSIDDINKLQLLKEKTSRELEFMEINVRDIIQCFETSKDDYTISLETDLNMLAVTIQDLWSCTQPNMTINIANDQGQLSFQIFNSGVPVPIASLSSGQSAIISICIITALVRISQTFPFFVFDEVDANLDSEGIALYISMLNTLIQTETQVFCTTFRDQTVEQFNSIMKVTLTDSSSNVGFICK